MDGEDGARSEGRRIAVLLEYDGTAYSGKPIETIRRKHNLQ